MTILLADEDIERARSLSLRRGGLGVGPEGVGRCRRCFWFPSELLPQGKKGVCTMCTPWASDRVVLVPDWAGLRRLAGEWREFKGWNPVRVPPRAQCFRRSGSFLVFFPVDSVHTLASDLMFRVCGVPKTAYSVVWGSG